MPSEKQDLQLDHVVVSNRVARLMASRKVSDHLSETAIKYPGRQLSLSAQSRELFEAAYSHHESHATCKHCDFRELVRISREYTGPNPSWLNSLWKPSGEAQDHPGKF